MSEYDEDTLAVMHSVLSVVKERGLVLSELFCGIRSGARETSLRPDPFELHILGEVFC